MRKRRSKQEISSELERKDENGFIILESPEGMEMVRDKKGRVVVQKIKKNKKSDESENDSVVAPDVKVTEAELGQYVYDKSINFAANINIGRSLPWLEDGLKFVERRVLYTMFRAGWTANKPMVRVATITGRMIETVYPHGEAPPAQTIYRLGRDFQAMIPYIEAGGGYGNAVTMKAAAPRYASARLSKYAMDCFFSEEDGIAPVYDVKEAYTKTDIEPVYLATRFPNILMQWNFGIGSGAATTFAAFNAIDVFETTLKLMDHPNAKIEIYPDTPTPLEITNKTELKHCFDKKRFTIDVRSPYYVDTLVGVDRNGKKYDMHVVVFTSCPMQTRGELIEEQIRKIKQEDEKRDVADKKLPEVINTTCTIKNGGTPGQLRLVVEYEHGYDPHALAEKLIKSTSLGMTYGANYTVAHDYMPKNYTPREILLEWIKLRFDQKRRYFSQKKKLASREKAQTRALIIVLEDKKHGGMDKCIAIIKASKNDEETKAQLCKTFGLTEFQATIIMNLRLKTLNKANIDVEKDKYRKACEDYDKYTTLCKEKNVRNAIKEDLKYGLKQYGMPRRAKLVDDENEKNFNEKKILVYNNDQFYCLHSYDELPKIANGVDSSYTVTREISNSDNLILFNKKGQMKILNGFSFNYTDTGIAMEKVAFADVVNVSVISDLADRDIALVTKFGYGKIMSYDDIGKSVKGKVITLNSGDELVGVVPVTENGILGMIDKDLIYYVRADSIPKLKRSAAGNRLVKVKTPLNITGVIFADNEYPYLMIYGESGYIKILDTAYLGFSKRTANCISMKGKLVYNVIPIDNKETTVTLYNTKGAIGITINLGDKIQFKTETGAKKTFPMSTSIGNPVKLLSVGKHEFYRIF